MIMCSAEVTGSLTPTVAKHTQSVEPEERTHRLISVSYQMQLYSRGESLSLFSISLLPPQNFRRAQRAHQGTFTFFAEGLLRSTKCISFFINDVSHLQEWCQCEGHMTVGRGHAPIAPPPAVFGQSHRAAAHWTFHPRPHIPHWGRDKHKQTVMWWNPIPG